MKRYNHNTTRNTRSHTAELARVAAALELRARRTVAAVRRLQRAWRAAWRFRTLPRLARRALAEGPTVALVRGIGGGGTPVVKFLGEAPRLRNMRLCLARLLRAPPPLPLRHFGTAFFVAAHPQWCFEFLGGEERTLLAMAIDVTRAYEALLLHHAAPSQAAQATAAPQAPMLPTAAVFREKLRMYGEHFMQWKRRDEDYQIRRLRVAIASIAGGSIPSHRTAASQRAEVERLRHRLANVFGRAHLQAFDAQVARAGLASITEASEGLPTGAIVAHGQYSRAELAHELVLDPHFRLDNCYGDCPSGWIRAEGVAASGREGREGREELLYYYGPLPTGGEAYATFAHDWKQYCDELREELEARKCTQALDTLEHLQESVGRLTADARFRYGEFGAAATELLGDARAALLAAPLADETAAVVRRAVLATCAVLERAPSSSPPPLAAMRPEAATAPRPLAAPGVAEAMAELLRDEPLLSPERWLVCALSFLRYVVDELQLRDGNSRLLHLAPMVQGDAGVSYEREKFALALRDGVHDLSRTTAWLRLAESDVRALRGNTPLAESEAPAYYVEVHLDGVLNLIVDPMVCQSAPMHRCPETLWLDMRGLTTAAGELRDIMLRASALVHLAPSPSSPSARAVAAALAAPEGLNHLRRRWMFGAREEAIAADIVTEAERALAFGIAEGDDDKGAEEEERVLARLRESLAFHNRVLCLMRVRVRALVKELILRGASGGATTTMGDGTAGAAAARHRIPPAALPLLPRIVRAAARLARIVAVNREVHAERYNPLIAAAAARVLARPHVQGAPWRAYY